jgi:DNA invertase Pin-like site-specific DNA recombinase
MGRKRNLPTPIRSFEELRSKTVRSYVRESSERQAMADRNGPEIQRAGFRRFCDQWAIPYPATEYFDAASGRKMAGRSGLQQALDEAAEYDVLLVFHTSRAFRNVNEAALWKTRFEAAGVTLVFTEQQMISGDPRTKSSEGMYAIMDEAQSDTQAMFIKQGLRQKFERGLHNGTAPLGYERHYGPPGDPSNSELVIVPREANTVRHIYALHRTTNYSDLEIALAINAEVDADGKPLHRTKQGKPFNEGGIREILTNRIYTGVVVWHPYVAEEEVRSGRHEPIISQELFDEVRAIRAGRVHWSGRRSVARVYPLSGRARCFQCGARVVGDTGGQKNRRRMRHSRTGLCTGWRSHHAHVLEGQLGEFMAARVTLPEDWQVEVKKLLARPVEAPSDNAQRRAAVERAMESLRKQHMWGHIADEDYRTEHQALQRALDDIPGEQSAPFGLTDFSRSAKLLSEFGTLWSHPGVSDASRKAFIEEVFEQVQIDGLGIRAVKPAEEFLPLMAVATWGDIARESPVSRSSPGSVRVRVLIIRRARRGHAHAPHGRF